MPTRKPKRLFEMKKVNRVEIRQRQSDGYIDAMAICDACEKEFTNYMQVRATKRFLHELAREIGIDESALVQKKNGIDEIWVHPYVAINLSQWASPKLAVKIPKWIFEWQSKINEQDNSHTEFVSSSGIKFEDIDPDFTVMIRKAAKFNPDKENTEP